MSTKSYVLIPYRLQDHNKVKQKVFSIVPERDNSVLEAKTTIFGRRYGLLDFIFLFLFNLKNMYAKSHIDQSCGGLPKLLFFTKGVC
jgi:hypothetical protein